MAALLTLPLAAPCVAMTSLEMNDIAESIATIMVAEKPCGFTYDAGAVRAFIDSQVPPEEIDFPSVLQANLAFASLMFANLQDSALTAHCRAIENTARHFDFID